MVADQSSSGTNAPGFCIEKGGELVKIENERENEFVLALARKEAPPSVKSVWIGLKRNGGHWYWSDNSLPKYFNWAPNEPSNGKMQQHTHLVLRWPSQKGFRVVKSHLFCPGVASVVCKRLLPDSCEIYINMVL